MKRSYLARSEFRKYALYAVGEMLLIIVGILIALQIDNWNTGNKQEESLKTYLSSIARNIRDDLAEVRSIRESREETAALALWHELFVSERESFTRNEIAFASFALAEAQRIVFFNPNRTGFEALKSSGNLEQMQGRDVEQLLYDYYDTVGRIVQAERNYNEYVRQLALQVMTDWPDGLARWEFEDPRVLAVDRFEEMQPAFRKILRDTSTIALYTLAESAAQSVLEYEKLARLGAAFIHMNDNDTMSLDGATKAVLDGIYDPNSGVAYPVIVADGRILLHTYDLGIASSVDQRISGRSVGATATAGQRIFNVDSIQRSADSLRFDYRGGAEWAVMFFFVRGASASRPSLDFSSFDKLQLELKGDAGGEEVLVNIKDSTDPDDGSQTNIALTLTDQWQLHEVDLPRFENADLSHLHVVLAFLFFDQPQSFSLRNAKYLRSDRSAPGVSR